MDIKEAKQKLGQLNNRSKFDKMMGVCAIFTQLMVQHQLQPVIVGGLAVEIYSRSEYTTVDIDIVFSQRKIASECFSELGFSKAGRHWFHKELGISIEIPSDMLKLADPNKVIKLQLTDKTFVYVIGLEDIILDRLRACVHWTSTSDCEWGRRLFLLHRERLDMSYLLVQAEKDGTIDRLNQWI